MLNLNHLALKVAQKYNNMAAFEKVILTLFIIPSKKKSCIENTSVCRAAAGTAGAAPAFASVCVSFSNFYASVFSAVLVCVKVTHAFALCM